MQVFFTGYVDKYKTFIILYLPPTWRTETFENYNQSPLLHSPYLPPLKDATQACKLHPWPNCFTQLLVSTQFTAIVFTSSPLSLYLHQHLLLPPLFLLLLHIIFSLLIPRYRSPFLVLNPSLSSFLRFLAAIFLFPHLILIPILPLLKLILNLSLKKKVKIVVMELRKPRNFLPVSLSSKNLVFGRILSLNAVCWLLFLGKGLRKAVYWPWNCVDRFLYFDSFFSYFVMIFVWLCDNIGRLFLKCQMCDVLFLPTDIGSIEISVFTRIVASTNMWKFHKGSLWSSDFRSLSSHWTFELWMG